MPRQSSQVNEELRIPNKVADSLSMERAGSTSNKKKKDLPLQIREEVLSQMSGSKKGREYRNKMIC